jgi:very-short-patch-repair endonuclease
MTDLGHLKPHIGASGDPRDLEIADLATRQHGVVGYRQLLWIGLGRRAIQYRVAAGRLHPLYRGVYAVGHRVMTLEGRWMAAVLACGQGAVLSHRDAAMLHGLRHSSRRDIDVTAVRGRARGQQGITIHRSRRLHPDDCIVEDGIPVTTIARTLLDLAEMLTPHQLARVAEEAERLGLFDLRALDELMGRSRGRRGLKPLTAVIAQMRPFVPMTRSELERAFLDLVRAAGLPEPAMNLWVEGYEVDAMWSEQRLIVELDGGTYHGTTAARRRDPIRDARLQLAGFRVVRVSDEWVQQDPDGVVAVLAAYFRKPS